jgi:hypothetical protein
MTAGVEAAGDDLHSACIADPAAGPPTRHQTVDHLPGTERVAPPKPA